MRQNTFLTGVVIFLIMSLLVTSAIAAEAKDPAVGDWLLNSDFDGQPISSLLVISRDKDGNYQGSWVNFWGINNTDNLKIGDGKISFTQTNQFRDQEMTLTFAGTLKDGKLAGTLTSDEWESDFEGGRIAPLPAIVGAWEFRQQRQDREFVSKLIVSRDKDGKLSADWQSERGTWEISDVKYEDEKLTFARKNTDPNRPREMTYALTAKDDTISGTMTSPRGERDIEGKRLNGELIGKWELTVTSDFGDRKQLLWIRPDMTALYGSTEVSKISVEDGNVIFNYEIFFGDNSFENAFKGQLEAGTLTGEMTNSRGTQQVKGQKMTVAEKTMMKKPAAKPQTAQ